MTATQTRKKIPIGRRPRAEGTDPDTRTDILAAARKIFARRGFEGTSVREIAEEARVNKAMIYYHYQDKKNLYRSVLSDSFDTLRRVWDHGIFMSEATAREKIKTYIDGFIRFQHRNEDLRRILTMEYSAAGAKSENIKWIAKEYFAKNHASLAAILEQGMRTGELRKADPNMAVTALIGMIIHSFVSLPLASYVHGGKIDMSAEKLGAFVSGMFFDGIATPAPIKKPR